MRKRGQISVEYLAIVGFAMLMIFPLIYIYQQQSADLQTELAKNQIKHFSQQIVDRAEAVYYMGEPSKTTLKIYIPVEVTKIEIDETFNYVNVYAVLPDPAPGNTTFSEYSYVNIFGPDIEGRTGTVFIELTALENGVNITYADPK